MLKPTSNEALPTHLLLQMAKTYPIFVEDLAPQGCTYDILQGVWLLDSGGTMLVESEEPPRPKTKKEDIETGEDQKSE